MKLAGGILCDGLEQPITGHKFYDQVLHYVEATEHLLTGQVDVRLYSRVLLLVQHNSPECADQIDRNLYQCLVHRFGIHLNSLMEGFTLVTDWSATQPNIVGGITSSARVPFGAWWVECILHKMNTMLKIVNQAIKESSTIPWKDLERVKEIVRVFERGAYNNGLPGEFALYQECETRFGPNFDVVKRFLKTDPHVTAIINAKNHAWAKTYIETLDVFVDSITSSVTYCALNAIWEVLSGVRYMLNFMEGGDYPEIHQVVPM